MVNDPWFQHLGKTVTIMQSTTADGGGVDTWSAYNDKIGKERKLPGKIVGTNGVGKVLIMLDGDFPGPSYRTSFTNPGSMSSVAMEFREEVAKANGLNRFIWLDTSSMNAIKISDKKVKTKRAEKQTFVEMLKDDASEAAYRVASAKIAESVRNMLALAIMAQLGGNKYADTVTMILNTPMGVALVQSTAGYALTYAPDKFSGDPRIQRLAKEFRVAGMATAGGVVADKIFSQLEPLLEQALEMLPGTSAEKVRVEGEDRSNVVEIAQAESEEEESEVASESKQRMAANSR